jgi:hypothetical protein
LELAVQSQLTKHHNIYNQFERAAFMAALFLCARQGAHSKRCLSPAAKEVLYAPGKGKQ